MPQSVDGLFGEELHIVDRSVRHPVAAEVGIARSVEVGIVRFAVVEDAVLVDPIGTSMLVEGDLS